VGQSPAGNNVSVEADNIVGIRHQAMTGEDTEYWEDNMCCSELQSVWISDSAMISCSYDL
jgi:hypothetical protein